MKSRKTRLTVMAMVFATSCLWVPLTAQAQPCVTMVSTYMSSSIAPYTMTVVKFLSMSQTCQKVASYMAVCVPNGTAMVANPIAYGGPGKASCQWECNGTAGCDVTIDGSDNLPVELMEFSLDE